MSENKSKNIVIVALCITLIFMGVGFSLLSQNLTINGTASVDSSASWDIKIDSITPVSGVYAHETAILSNFSKTSALDSENETYLGAAYVDSNDSTQANFAVNFNEPGDYMIYRIKVGNHGSIDAKLSNTIAINQSTNQGINLTTDSYDQAAGGNAIFSVEFVDSSYAPIASAGQDGQIGTLIANSGSNHLLAKHYEGATTPGVDGPDVYYVKVTFNAPSQDLSTLPQGTASTTIKFVYQQAN